MQNEDKTVFIEQREQGGSKIWPEQINLTVPDPSTTARNRGYIDYDDWVEAAKGLMDFWNATLLPHDKPREIVRVYELRPDDSQVDLWKGLYPEPK